MAIVRLAAATPPLNTDTILHTAVRGSLASVIATNISPVSATVRIWVSSGGSASYLAYDTILPGNNSLETFRFPLQPYDTVYVRSSNSSTSFSLNGIYESNGTSHITVSAVAPNAPVLGDVWVNPSLYSVYFWTGSNWASVMSDTSLANKVDPLLLSGM